MRKNQKIRLTAGGCGIKLWQVAEAIGMNESSFSRKLRQELPPEEQDKILAIIKELAAKNVGCADA